MKRTKYFLTFMLTLMMTLGMSLSVCADESKDLETQTLLAEGIYEGDTLQTAAEMLGYEMVTDDGYVLESISISLSKNNPVDISTNSVTPTAIGDHIGDVVKSSTDVYFPDDPIASNWFDGPLTKVTKTYTRSVAAAYSCTTSVSVEVLNAGLSFNITESVTESTTWERPAISSSQRIDVKEYGVYDQYSFVLYNIWGTQKGTGYAYKPVGLYVAQATYSK